MFYFQKLLKENYIKRTEMVSYLGLSLPAYKRRLDKTNDFTLNELEDMKMFFVKRNIVGVNFDIGDFLNEVEETKKWKT